MSTLPPPSAYARVPIPAASLTGDITDFSIHIPLDDLPSEWWAAVGTGTDILCEKDDGTEVPHDLIDLDTGTSTGALRVKWSGTLSSSSDNILRIYPDAGPQSGLSTDAYDSGWLIYLPYAAGTDRTANGFSTTQYGGLTPGGTTGLNGKATAFSGSNYALWVHTPNLAAWSSFIICNGSQTPSTARLTNVIHFSNVWGVQWDHTAASFVATMAVRYPPSNWIPISYNGISANTWYQLGGVDDGSVVRAIKNGVNTNSVANSVIATAGAADYVFIGRQSHSTPMWVGTAQHFSYHSVGRSAAWYNAEWKQLTDPASFFGTITWVDDGGGTPTFKGIMNASGMF